MYSLYWMCIVRIICTVCTSTVCTGCTVCTIFTVNTRCTFAQYVLVVQDGTGYLRFTGCTRCTGCATTCLSVCLYSINVKTADTIMPKFCEGPHVTPRKVYGQSDFKYVILKYFYLKLFNFVKIKMRVKIS